jgi:hypothetical protein
MQLFVTIGSHQELHLSLFVHEFLVTSLPFGTFALDNGVGLWPM